MEARTPLGGASLRASQVLSRVSVQTGVELDPIAPAAAAAGLADRCELQVAYAIGRAYVEQFEPRRIAVGRDMRVSSPSMAEAVMGRR